ncbi:MAG: hypothetical protein ACYDC2_03170 [Solirubrobacteraceae bacterium]
MRLHARSWLMTLVVGVLTLGALPAAAQASFAVEGFTATNCKVETCAGEEHAPVLPENAGVWNPKEPTLAEAKTQGFTQAGGRVPFGVTDFKVKTTGAYPKEKPEGAPISKVRVDVAAGLATSPAAVPTCSMSEFGEEALPSSGLYKAPTCGGATEIGKEYATLYIKAVEEATGAGDVSVSGVVYNLVPPEGLASYYGAAIKLPIFITKGKLEAIFHKTRPEIENAQYYAHSFVKGDVEWGKEAEGTNVGDYHDYFTVAVSTENPLISSRQVLYGTRGEGDFITNGTSCPGDNTTFVTLTTEAGETSRRPYTTPIGLKGCNLTTENPAAEGIAGITQVPFSPTFSFSESSSANDKPTPFSTEATLPNEPKAVAQSQVRTATVTLPEGMTLNPSAAHGLEACTPAQARIHSSAFGVECPSGSNIGTVSLNVPTLPNGSLTGNVYLGAPEGGTITDPPFTMYVVANSTRYGVSVRLRAEVIPNTTTGQLTTVFPENPEQPFTDLAINFDRNTLAPIANPLLCGTPQGASSFVPTTGTPTVNASFGVPITGCGASIPFALGQSSENENESGGGNTSFALNYSRGDGNQYLRKIRTTLPAGLVGKIPNASQCAEAQANAGSCAGSSRIGYATVLAGSGSAPYRFTGPVYLTGPYGGAPYGLSIAVPAVAGPFNLGTVVTRAALFVDPTTAQVTAESTVPTIFKGIPLRLRSITVTINRQGFMLNPTNCSPLATVSTLTSTEGATQTLSTPFQVSNCSTLGFSPKFGASTSARASRVNGASLVTTLTEFPGQANVKSVKVQLPKQLPSRLTSLQKACTAAVFNANPASCPATSSPGTAEAVTPTLPGKMTGKAYFVSHGGAAFPDLDLVLEDQGVRVILVGNTDIKNNVTTTTFASTPDVPVTSVTVRLPTGPHSALAAFGNLCTKPLVMPTTIIGQNGKSKKQNTIIGVGQCGVQIVGRKVVGRTLYLTVKAFEAGRLVAGGRGVGGVRRRVGRKGNYTLKLPLRHGKPFTAHVRVSFFPRYRHGTRSSARTAVRFR